MCLESCNADALSEFIDKHCVDCHGAETQKAGLRLDTLAADFHDEKTAETWTRVYDKLVAGEMPPKKRERPQPQEIEAATAFLHAQLHAASLERQQKKGRVIVRRLNGTEYENTVRDLLGTNVALKEMLPEDNTTAGFDNVSSGLDLSATHFLLYQEAAAKAVRSVIPDPSADPVQRHAHRPGDDQEGPELPARPRPQLQAPGRCAHHLQQAAALRSVRDGRRADGGTLPDSDDGVRGGRRE